uniref:Cytochrome p450 n=1 Tax=Moniliophthora roreri TaxID=221103 RepID=A0A0W0FP35_MONRR
MTFNLHLAYDFRLLLQWIGISVSSIFLVPFLSYVYSLYITSNSHLPGPPNHSLPLGNRKELYEDDNASITNNWINQYGRIHKRAAFFGRSEIIVADLKGLTHVLKNDYCYVKPDQDRYLLIRVAGPGLAVPEQDEHKKQRRVMNPAFGPAQIRGLTKIFVDKSIELRDAWANAIGNDETGRVDAMIWLSRMTLDVIGKAGFNYDFHSLQGEPNELNVALAQASRGQMTAPVLLKIFFPVLRLLPESNSAIRQARNTISRIGRQLVADGKAALSVDAKGAKDLLSLLVQSNASF